MSCTDFTDANHTCLFFRLREHFIQLEQAATIWEANACSRILITERIIDTRRSG